MYIELYGLIAHGVSSSDMPVDEVAGGVDRTLWTT